MPEINLSPKLHHLKATGTHKDGTGSCFLFLQSKALLTFTSSTFKCHTPLFFGLSYSWQLLFWLPVLSHDNYKVPKRHNLREGGFIWLYFRWTSVHQSRKNVVAGPCKHRHLDSWLTGPQNTMLEQEAVHPRELLTPRPHSPKVPRPPNRVQPSGDQKSPGTFQNHTATLASDLMVCYATFMPKTPTFSIQSRPLHSTFNSYCLLSSYIFNRKAQNWTLDLPLQTCSTNSLPRLRGSSILLRLRSKTL